MSVKVKLMVIKFCTAGDEEMGYVSDVLSLRDNYAVLDDIETQLANSGKFWKAIQLPEGPRSHVLGEVLDDSGPENGWLLKDCYDLPLKSLTGTQLKEVLLQSIGCNTYNKRLAEFIGELFSDCDIVIYFC